MYATYNFTTCANIAVKNWYQFSTVNLAKCEICASTMHIVFTQKGCPKYAMADNVHARIEEFLSGGGGVQARRPENGQDNGFLVLKDIENLAIILVPLIMILSRGHTGQIKG